MSKTNLCKHNKLVEDCQECLLAELNEVQSTKENKEWEESDELRDIEWDLDWTERKKLKNFIRSEKQKSFEVGKAEALKIITQTPALDHHCRCEGLHVLSFRREDYDKILKALTPQDITPKT